MKEHLIVEQEFIPHRKKAIYNVWNKEHDVFVGCVKWRSGWRCYVWQQAPDMDMSKSCTDEMWRKVEAFENDS